MNLFEKVMADNQLRHQRLEEGKLNCIPFPFSRSRKVYPGVEQGKYLIITASQKVGKSKLADFLFVYEPLFYMMNHPELKVKVIYFTLEMTADEKMNEFLCHLLFRLDKIRISTRELRGVDRKCDPKIKQLLMSDRYQKYINAYLKMVTFNDSDKNPTGIRNEYKKYALSHGHENWIRPPKKDSTTGMAIDNGEINAIEPYTPDDPEEYVIVIVDNAANITTEVNYEQQRAAIEKVSKDGVRYARNRYKYIFVLIQHQAQSQEGIENIKLGRMRPTSDGLGDNKTTTRDMNCIIGLYNPYKFIKEMKNPIYEGYDISRLKGYCRFLEFIEDRDYGAGGSQIGLFFDGATSTFNELPPRDDIAGLEKVYKYIEKLEDEKYNPLELTNPT